MKFIPKPLRNDIAEDLIAARKSTSTSLSYQKEKYYKRSVEAMDDSSSWENSENDDKDLVLIKHSNTCQSNIQKQHSFKYGFKAIINNGFTLQTAKKFSLDCNDFENEYDNKNKREASLFSISEIENLKFKINEDKGFSLNPLMKKYSNTKINNTNKRTVNITSKSLRFRTDVLEEISENVNIKHTMNLANSQKRPSLIIEKLLLMNSSTGKKSKNNKK